ncbi:hypothetical protein SJAV_21690 [Sulfurisphaera javensis]|uniref:Uncharacterized protein n=1 Tax=Sulfurisphaera javensis TaxID=2049879 RepID=A0AAT9GTU4_9CREN
MKKTLVRLDDEIYEELVNLSIKKYGNTKHISDVLNEILRKTMRKEKRRRVKMSVSVTLENGEKLSPEEIERLANEVFSNS